MSGEAIIARFMRFVSPEPNTGCWLFDGGGRPYGNFWSGSKNISAHRFSYLYFKGSINCGLQIDHRCRVTCCVNPDHLEAVTCQVNQMRKPIQGNQYVLATHCVRNHPLSGSNLRINNKTGQRVCRACNSERSRQFKMERRNAVR